MSEKFLANNSHFCLRENLAKLVCAFLGDFWQFCALRETLFWRSSEIKACKEFRGVLPRLGQSAQITGALCTQQVGETRLRHFDFCSREQNAASKRRFRQAAN